jgi:hypothetical protein
MRREHEDDRDRVVQDLELLEANSGASSSVLLYDNRLAPGTPESVEHPVRVIHLPTGPISLVVNRPDALSLVEVELSEAGANTAIVEAMRGSGGERLVLFTRPGSDLRLNGLPAPIVAPLSLGDQLGIDPENLLHVSRLSQTTPVPAPAWLIGKSCEICLLPFTDESPVVLCSTCGAGRHMEGNEVPSEQRLECASLGACPNCQGESTTTGDLVYIPED